jgi:hypothetical protein
MASAALRNPDLITQLRSPTSRWGQARGSWCSNQLTAKPSRLTSEPADDRIAVDRRNSGVIDFHPSFASRDEAPLPEDVSAGVDVESSWTTASSKCSLLAAASP